MCRSHLRSHPIVRNLYLIRHGKSDWDADYSGDHARPLASRGKRESRKIGAYLKRASVYPDLILCSTAMRTKQTLDLLKEEAGWRSEVRYEKELYLADPEYVCQLIAQQTEDVSTLAVIGHQPFTGQVASRFLDGRPLEVPTACVIGMEFDAPDWQGVLHETGRLLMHLLPRRLD